MDLELQAESFAQKIKHIIISTSGHTLQDASTEEFYFALCSALREEIMINWTATLKSLQQKKPRTISYLSMEYLPGRLLHNHLLNLGAMDWIQAVVKKLGRHFSDVLACEMEPGLGNGGLGRLASSFFDSLATMQYPAFGYGLRYQYGIFEQEIWNGIQIERPDRWLLNANPWEVRLACEAVTVRFGGKAIPAKNQHGDDVCLLENFEEVRALPFDTPIIGFAKTQDFSVLTLRLWSTKESPRNFLLQRFNAGLLEKAAENTSLTDVLYPSDNHELGKRFRLKQEFLLVSASLQDILRRHLKTHGDISSLADKVRIQINDTHPALVIAELMHTLTKNYDFSWQSAWETTTTCCSFTNHTVLREGLEEWNEHRIQDLLPRQYRIIQKLNMQLCNQVRSRFPGDEEKIRRISCIESGQIRMAHLAIFGSHKINGVALLHTEILKHIIFKDFYDLTPEKFINITNGVTQRRWLCLANPLLAKFITERIGEEWILNFQIIQKLKNFAVDRKTQEEFLAIRKKNKEALLSFLKQTNAIRGPAGKIIAHSEGIGTEALFDVQIKRFHEYKRQLMNALHLIMLYQELKKDPHTQRIPRFAIFGGKAAPSYEKAKQIMQLICALARTFHKDPATQGKLAIAFIEDYNVSKAEKIIPAADLSEQISTAGWEASGTGNMKFAMSGALTIATEDGSNIEIRQSVTDAWWPFRFGGKAQENFAPYNPQQIYQNDAAIRQAVDALNDPTFVETEGEQKVFKQLHDQLVRDDPFRVLKDLRSYYETQKKVEELYRTPLLWAETALHNIAGMGPFSSDRSIREYAEKIWEVFPHLPDADTFTQVREEYSEHDRCRVR